MDTVGEKGAALSEDAPEDLQCYQDCIDAYAGESDPSAGFDPMTVMIVTTVAAHDILSLNLSGRRDRPAKGGPAVDRYYISNSVSAQEDDYFPSKEFTSFGCRRRVRSQRLTRPETADRQPEPSASELLSWIAAYDIVYFFRHNLTEA